ncbi:hypothetical protein V8G54_027330 [Vigna mungo]|uniref:Uncharacterized protein n=1 Tax=Vigna mungo TaxID=3915 RepID=A0AAQ3RRA2_VIGMU
MPTETIPDPCLIIKAISSGLVRDAAIIRFPSTSPFSSSTTITNYKKTIAQVVRLIHHSQKELLSTLFIKSVNTSILVLISYISLSWRIKPYGLYNHVSSYYSPDQFSSDYAVMFFNL